MTRDPAESTKAQRQLEAIAADVPPELTDADDTLTRYGRWANTYSRGGRPATVDRQFCPEMDGRESLESWLRRCAEVPQYALMPTRVALGVQRVIASLPGRERVVLAALYVPRRIPAARQLQILGIPPAHSRALHLVGLRRFWHGWKVSAR